MPAPLSCACLVCVECVEDPGKAKGIGSTLNSPPV